jgi:hypothetical protein
MFSPLFTTVRPDVQASFLSWLAGVEADRADNYRVYREYYDGDHDTLLTDRQRHYLSLKSGTDFRANYCPIVVDALAERLVVTGLECEGQAEILWGWWVGGRLDGLQAVLHTAAVRDGDAYVIVEWDDARQQPAFFFEMAEADGEGVKAIYDEATNRPVMAVKRWRIRNGAGAGYMRRMNVYHPDRVEKYVSNDKQAGGMWQRWEEEGQPWPLPWLDAAGAPLGLPVIHFKNRDQGYNYGQSELKDVIPLQNALNKTVIDLLAAADTTSFRIYWMVGDDPSDIAVAPGSWVYSPRPAAGPDATAMGYFPGEDLGNLINLKDSFAIEIARVSRTPVSYFQVSGQRPAEGTLKQEESGLVGRARARQIAFGNSWEDAFALARRLWNAFGPGPELDESVPINCVWRDAESRNEKALLETLMLKKNLGVPPEKLWSEMGYNAGEIAEMQAQARAVQASEADLGEQLIAAFERAPAAAARAEQPAADMMQPAEAIASEEPVAA